jgi:hypothetical protein
LVLASPPCLSPQDRRPGAEPGERPASRIQGTVANALKIHSPEITSMTNTAAANAFTNIR